MVAQFFGLKLSLLSNTFRRSRWQLVGIVVALIYGLAVVFVIAASLIALRFTDVATATRYIVPMGTLIALGFLMLPLVFGVDDTLDPRAFSLYGIPTTRLANGLALAALVGVPALVIALVSLAQIVTWSVDPLSAILATVGAGLIVATAVLSGRVSTSIAAFALATRRAREFGAVVALIGFVSVSPVLLLLTTVNWERDGDTVLDGIAAVSGWSPFGAAWAAPAASAAGHDGEALLKLAIAAVFVAVLWVAWRLLVGLMLVTPQREARKKSYGGLGWFSRMPDTQAGAIAARSITYWLRDSRYRISLVAIPIAPIVFVTALAVAGVPWSDLALVPVPAICLFLSWSVHNDVAFDNSAVWLHVASDVKGNADRVGRLAFPLIVGVPLAVVGSPITASIFGRWDALPSIFGVSICILLAGLGLSSFTSARFPYAAVRPGDSPFNQPQATGAAAGLVQALAFFATIIASVPTLVLGALGLFVSPGLAWVALVVGLATGVGCLILGVKWGGSIFARRGPEMLAFTLRN